MTLKHNTSFDVCFISGCERLIACAEQYRVLELWKGYWASVTFRVGPCGLWTRQVCSPILLRRLLLTQSGAFQWREHPRISPFPGECEPPLNTWFIWPGRVFIPKTACRSLQRFSRALWLTFVTIDQQTTSLL